MMHTKVLLGSMYLWIQEVLDVKQRLHQIQMEMSKLRSRQIKMKKEGKPNSLLNSGKANPLVVVLKSISFRLI